MNLAQVIAKRKNGEEKFKTSFGEINIQLLDFWQWAVSDLLSNATRGILAEFIVASALGIEKGIRNEWDSYDITDHDGTRVEVKTSAYLQSWAQSDFSKINFDIRPSRKWRAETGKYDDNAIRQNDIYAFCLLRHKDKETVDPMDLDQWIFYILPTIILNEKMKSQKSLSLGKLLKLNPEECKFEDIRAVINKLKSDPS